MENKTVLIWYHFGTAFSKLYKSTCPISVSFDKSAAGVHEGQMLTIDDMSNINRNKLQRQKG